ncbi:NAD(P)/FAD-dependent oxidoreductase [Nocardioides sp. NPDC006303]|uniref:flavin-containing monooxygenase n=1 Tax=Nocardioides sp. NPDC006303 TaxID=3156747 RepID=UPI0033A1531B
MSNPRNDTSLFLDGSTVHDVVIIGTGFSGLAMGTQLKRRGNEDFIILERANEVGGTWRDNTYPGAACDQPSHMYSYSFRLNPDWSSIFSEQPEILDYLKATAEEEDLLPHVRFNANVDIATWDADTRTWVIQTSRGVVRGKVLVSAAGLLSEPRLPEIPGLGDFKGDVFHSARWDAGADLAGKRAGVVGTGASGIQIVPRIAPELEKLFVFQRTPHWVTPRGDYQYSEVEKRMYRRNPDRLQELRTSMFWENEERFAQRAAIPVLLAKAEQVALALLEEQVPDPELRARLTPDYAIGCKRILKSSDFYPALMRDNVDLVAEGISHIEADAVIGKNGGRYELDVLVLATGFEATEPPIAAHIVGTGGRTLAERWSGGAEAYQTTSVSGFPNLFLIGGPNTGIGHNSQVYMFEAQIEHIMGVLDLMRARGIAAVEVAREAEHAFIEEMEKKAATTVWLTGGCQTWYIDQRNGRLTTLWPDYSHSFQEQIPRVFEDSYMPV